MTPDHEALTYGDEAVRRPADTVLEDRATDYGVRVAQADTKKPAKKPAAKSPAPTKTATKLLVHDAATDSIKVVAPIYARQIMKVPLASVKGVSDWPALVSLLQGYKKIDHLVLMFHGTPGSLIIGHEHKSLDEAAKLFTGAKPKIGRIDFEACNVGEGPDALVPFGQLFGAAKVTGWNHFWITSTLTGNVPAGTTAAAMETVLAPFKGYLLPGSPSASELAKKPGKYVLISEWFRVDFNEDPLPPPPAPNELDTRKSFKRRSSGKDRTVKAAEAAKLREAWDKAPVKPLERVVVEI